MFTLRVVGGHYVADPARHYTVPDYDLLIVDMNPEVVP